MCVWRRESTNTTVPKNHTKLYNVCLCEQLAEAFASKLLSTMKNVFYKSDTPHPCVVHGMVIARDTTFSRVEFGWRVG